MRAKIDLTGKQFGKWTVLYVDLATLGKKTISWVCKCECGLIKSVFRNSLLRGGSSSCMKCARLNAPLWHPISYLWKRTKDSARSRKSNIRNIKFELTKDDMWNQFIKQDKKCALTGIELIIVPLRRQNKDNRTTASIDRIDSNGDYTVDNIQWVHKDLNTMKWNIEQNKFIEYCKLVAKKFT